MTKNGFSKPDYTRGPYPEAHTIGGDPAKKLPPDGTYQPVPDFHSRASAWQAEKAIGVSYPPGRDFGPFVHHMGEGLHTSFNLDFINSIPFSVAGVHPHVGLLLFALALNQRPDVIIETGTQMGYSTLFLAKACELWQQGRVFTIDPVDTNICQEVKDHPYIECIKARSDQVLGPLCDRLGQVDFAFIDSWKRLALDEFLTVEPYIVDGGLVVFHDTQFLNSGRTLYTAIQDHFPQYDKVLFVGTPHEENPHHYFGHCDNLGLYVLRKREADPFLDVADADTASLGAKQVSFVEQDGRLCLGVYNDHPTGHIQAD